MQSFPPAPGSFGGSIPEEKAFHRCIYSISSNISHAAQARKSMLAVTASQPTDKPTTPQHLPSPLPSRPPNKPVVSFQLTQPLDIVEENSSSMMRAVAAHGLQTRYTHAPSRTCSPTQSPFFLTALLAYGAVPSRLPCKRLLNHRKLAAIPKSRSSGKTKYFLDNTPILELSCYTVILIIR